MTTKYICPDTNIFLHFQSLNEIDFLELLDCTQVVILIAPSVIDELDKLKYEHSIEGIRDRAWKRLRMLWQWINDGGEIRKNIKLTRMGRPAVETYDKHSLSPLSKDDQIIASIIENQETLATNVILLTNDYAILMRAQDHGIEAIPLSEEFRLEHARDPLKERILELERQLVVHQTRMPKLGLTFNENLTEASWSIPGKVEFSQEKLDKDLIPIREELDEKLGGVTTPSFEFTSLEDALARLKLSSSLVTIPPEEIERYKSEVDQYPETYKSYFLKWIDATNKNSTTLAIDLKLQNLGTYIAENIYIDLYLPEKLTWLIDLPPFPKRPSYPKPPMTAIQMYSHGIAQGVIPPYQQMNLATKSSPERSKTQPYLRSKTELMWEIPQLVHNSLMNLDRVYAVFNSYDEVSNFELRYSIREKNTPELVEGRLLLMCTIEDIMS